MKLFYFRKTFFLKIHFQKTSKQIRLLIPVVFLFKRFINLHLQHCYIKLTNTKKYRVTIATFFLVVYAFIATPVQLWHKHNDVASIKSTSEINKKLTNCTVQSAQQNIEEANCAICSHFYTAYSLVATVSLETPIVILQQNNAFYIFTIPFSPLLNSCNKGPPSLAA